MQRSVIIVAGGSGKRMGAAVPKQFLLLNGLPVLCHAIAAFHRFDAAMQCVVVLPADQQAGWQALCAAHGFQLPHTVVPGGAERFHSVRNGLEAVRGEGVVGVHDGVRPLIGQDVIARCFAAAEAHGAAIPVTAMHPSVRELTDSGNRPLDRSRLRLVQTPQCFHTALLRAAFALPFDPAFTDEATLVERTGRTIHLVDGDDRNLKITTPVDLQLATLLSAG